MWTQQQRHEIIINSTWWKNRNFSLHKTVVHKEKNRPDNSYFRTIIKTDHDPSTSTKNTDVSNTYPPKTIITHHQPKVKSVRFEDPYDHINLMDNTHEETHPIYTQKKTREDYDYEQK